MGRKVIPVLLAAIWISVSEFLRNEFLLKKHWVSYYEAKGLIFPAEPVNGLIWGLWSLMFAVAIFFISQTAGFRKTMILSWWMAFAMMWVVIGNMGVLPVSILPLAIPLSLLEAWIATWIIFAFKS